MISLFVEKNSKIKWLSNFFNNSEFKVWFKTSNSITNGINDELRTKSKFNWFKPMRFQQLVHQKMSVHKKSPNRASPYIAAA